MLTVSGIQKSYGGRTLFADASLQVNRGDRIGLVGPNGAGKTTLFGLILGEESADAGSIVLQRGTTAGYLPQESAPAGEDTVMGLALAGDPELGELWRQWQDLEAREAADSPEAGPVRRRFEELDGHRRVAQARKILRGLAFRETDFDRRAATLSGGWVMRAHLARLLVQQPDLLLLDEPTNHLDLEALLWLQDYLKHYPGGILLISHDREFLNELVDSIVEIRLSRLVRFRGNYDAYLEQREASDEQWVAAWKNQQREIARLQRFVDRFRAKNTKAAQAQSKLKQIDRMEKIEAPPGQEATLEFRFPQPVRSGLKVVQLRGVEFAYPPDPRDPHRLGGTVYRGLDFEVERGQRIVLVGPNGAGKSTLLKLLAGVLQPLGGERRLGHNVKPGYYSQYRIEQLDENATVLEEALDTPQRVGEQFARTVLGGFLFRGDDVFKRVSVLSGGEKSRLALVKLLLDPPNLLLMDEPTTHLDIPSTDALLAALAPFEGTLVFISHDVYFLRELASHVIHVKDGRVTHYPGGYDYYLDKTREAARARAAAQAPPPTAPRESEPGPAEREKTRKRREAEARQQRARQRRELHREVTRLEQEIQRLEARQKELTIVMEQPETYQEPGRALELNREFLDHAAQLQVLNAEWETAATQLHTLDAED